MYQPLKHLNTKIYNKRTADRKQDGIYFWIYKVLNNLYLWKSWFQDNFAKKKIGK